MESSTFWDCLPGLTAPSWHLPTPWLLKLLKPQVLMRWQRCLRAHNRLLLGSYKQVGTLGIKIDAVLYFFNGPFRKPKCFVISSEIKKNLNVQRKLFCLSFKYSVCLNLLLVTDDRNLFTCLFNRTSLWDRWYYFLALICWGDVWDMEGISFPKWNLNLNSVMWSQTICT